MDYLKLIEKANYYSKLYDEGHPEISDEEWDNLYFEIQKMEKSGEVKVSSLSPTQSIEYKVMNELKKVGHNHPMLSLDKTKEVDKVDDFIGSKDSIAMSKMDGLTCSLRYIEGKLVSAETRGDGIIGEDILHNALVIPSIPKKIDYKDELIVDGEIICTYTDFEEFKNEYKNPRNFAAGSIRLLDAKECAKRKLTFVAWDIIKGFENDDKLNTCLLTLEDMGFTIVPYTLAQNKEKAINSIKSISEIYPIDGVVFKFNSRSYGKSLGRTEHHFKNAIAYKFYDETYITYARSIQWTMGRTGVLTPVVIFDPIDINGTINERASLHNLSVLKELGLKYQGQKIEVFKANLIIPQVAKVYPYEGEDASVQDMEIPSVCPICGGTTKQIETDHSLVLKCTNPNCEGKLINRLDHFCGKKGLDIKGLSKATLEKLINWGWIGNIYELYSLSNFKEEWEHKAGFGEKSVGKILNAIEESKHVQLSNFIASLGIPLIGSSASKVLAKEFLTWDNFIEKVESDYSFAELPNFGDEMNKAIKEFDYFDAKNIVELLSFEEVKQQEVVNNNLKDTVIVITGKLQKYKNRDALKSDIESRGGKVGGAITKKTSLLINNDKNSTSAKNKAAIEAGIPIVTEEEFLKKYFDI